MFVVVPKCRHSIQKGEVWDNVFNRKKAKTFSFFSDVVALWTVESVLVGWWGAAEAEHKVEDWGRELTDAELSTECWCDLFGEYPVFDWSLYLLV